MTGARPALELRAVGLEVPFWNRLNLAEFVGLGAVLAAGRTTLVVAHRLDQAARADRVVVLARGGMVETGRHAALVEQGGRYTALWLAWQDEREQARTRMDAETAEATAPG